MHETVVAQNMVEAISQEARAHGGRPVRAKISCGQLNAVNDEVLSFAFEAISQGTPCEGMALQVEHKPLQATCKRCGGTFDVVLSNAQCLECQSDEFELLPDAPLLLEEIEFEKE
ncbi:MAG: hydrogenase maturation nickel metallochaperone HypA [Phycisphaerales bacterium]|nr:MAG: hydrogenase maturation nickel metallochaperone HypA [Phycisphaerales bacterium]